MSLLLDAGDHGGLIIYNSLFTQKLYWQNLSDVTILVIRSLLKA